MVTSLTGKGIVMHYKKKYNLFFFCKFLITPFYPFLKRGLFGEISKKSLNLKENSIAPSLIVGAGRGEGYFCIDALINRYGKSDTMAPCFHRY